MLVARQLIAYTEVHARRDEVAASVVSVRHLTTEVLETETEAEVTRTHRQLDRLLVVQGNVSSHRPGRVHLCGTGSSTVHSVVEVRVEETNGNRHRYVLM